MLHMKSIWILFLSFLPLSLVLSQDSLYSGKYPPSEVPDRIILTWSDDPASSMAVTWRTATSVTEGFAELVIADPSPYFEGASIVKASTTRYVSDQNEAHYHAVNFQELEANTLYAYRVGTENAWSEWSHFRTANSQEAPFSFIYLGDAQNDLKARWSRTIREAYRQLPKADFMIHAGDLVNIPDADDEWGEWFYAGGWIYRTTPSIATPGNHEYNKLEDESRMLCGHWKPTFTFPANGPDKLLETTYYLDYQGARIISLNSPEFVYNDSLDQIQIDWLEKVLQETKQKWIIVTLHHPIYSPAASRDNPDLRNAFLPLFNKYGVDIVLQGHDHTYARGGNNLPAGSMIVDSSGPVFVVSVSGPKMYSSNMADWMDRAAQDIQLYQLIHINDSTLTFEAYTTTGKLYDKFLLEKAASGKNRFIDMAPGDMPERLGSPPGSPLFNKMNPTQMDAWKSKFEAFKARRKSQ